MMSLSTRYFFGIVSVILIIIGLVIFLPEESEPVVEAPPVLSDSTVEAYVRENISMLSPEPEQLGGTFYVTSIEVSDGRGTVSYEDGHNAYTASFTYAAGPNGEPDITSFVVEGF